MSLPLLPPHLYELVSRHEMMLSAMLTPSDAFRDCEHECFLVRKNIIAHTTGRGIWSRTWVGLAMNLTVHTTTMPCCYANTA